MRRLQYSRSTSTWYRPWAKVVSVRKTLGAPHPIDFVLHTPGGSDLIGSKVNLKEKLQLMWQHNPPVTQGNQVLVGISIDGTKLWQRSFEHLAVGELGSRLPSGEFMGATPGYCIFLQDTIADMDPVELIIASLDVKRAFPNTPCYLQS